MQTSRGKQVFGWIEKAGFALPRELTVMLTRGCNLRCAHCWPDSSPQKESRAAPIETLKPFIEEWCRLELAKIILTGGEPLTNPQWLEVLEFACSQKRLETVCLQTNGTLLDQRNVKRLAEIGSGKLTIQVSLEGNTDEIHDAVRGEGSFKAAIRGLELLSEAGLGTLTTVALTETRLNFSSIPDLMERLKNMGIGFLVTGTLVQAGRAHENPWLEPPTSDQYLALLSLYHREAGFRKKYREMGNIAGLEWWLGKENSTSEACTLFERPYVTEAGVLYPCIMLPAEHLAVSDAFDGPVAEVLRRAISKWSNLAEIIKTRKSQIRECRTCFGKNHCAGGCMGRAFSTHGDFMAVEDRCRLRKAVYAWQPAGELQ